MSLRIAVTGGSSGIGLAIARQFAAKGHTVYSLSRRPSADGVRHIPCDVADESSVRQAFAALEQAEGALDILVNNAGFGISGAAEYTAPEDAHAQLELNLYGADRAARAVIPVMRAQGGGRIVCMSSIAGILPIPFQLWYSVSKAAINAYVLALQNEVRPFGISVCAVMPGDIASGFTANRKKTLREDAYGGRVARSVARMEHDEETGMSPEAAGAFIAKTALRRSSRPLIALGLPYKAAAAAAKLLPRRLSNGIIGRMYAK